MSDVKCQQVLQAALSSVGTHECLTRQEISRNLQDPTGHFHRHNSSPLASIVSQINPIPAT